MTQRAYDVQGILCTDPECPITKRPMMGVTRHLHVDPTQPPTCFVCLGWGTVTAGAIPRGNETCPQCGGKGFDA